MSYALAKELGDSTAIKAAFDKNPAAMRPLIEREIEAHQPLIMRDYVAREYIMMLCDIIGKRSGNLHGLHDIEMQAALRKSGLSREKILENIQVELKKA